jgi:hypothetical protein
MPRPPCSASAASTRSRTARSTPPRNCRPAPRPTTSAPATHSSTRWSSASPPASAPTGRDLAARLAPTNPQELALALTAFAHEATGAHRTLTLCRYAILVQAGIQPALRAQLLATGGRVNAYFLNWLRTAGSTDPGRDAPIIMNHWTGLVLHQLAVPDPAFDPTAQITALVTTVIRPRTAEVPAP